MRENTTSTIKFSLNTNLVVEFNLISSLGVARLLELDRHHCGLLRRRRAGAAVEVQLHGQLEVRRESEGGRQGRQVTSEVVCTRTRKLGQNDTLSELL